MKYLKYFFVCGLVVLSTSSYTAKTSGLSVGVKQGNLSPDFNIYDESGNGFRLSGLKGQKVLLTLWAAYDAKSHMQHVLLANALKKENYPLTMVSVSFDRSKPVFENTLRMDGVNNGLHFVDTQGMLSEIYKKYRLENGFNSFLIDEEGAIALVNPTPDDLDKAFNLE